MDRFIIQKAQEDGWWVCTDTAFLIVARWREHDFNGSQVVTPLEDGAALTALNYARAMREMGDWLAANHYELLF